MVYNENLKKTSIDEIDLYEPYLWTFKIKHLCYPIAVIFMIGDSIEFFLTQTNYFGRHEPFYSQVEIPTNYTLQTISLIVGLFFIYGVFKEKSTPIAIFLWTVLEVNILYVILYTYKSISDMVDWRERIKVYVFLILRAILWWIVNSYHNFVKEMEYIKFGIVKKSSAFTRTKKYRFVQPNINV